MKSPRSRPVLRVTDKDFVELMPYYAVWLESGRKPDPQEFLKELAYFAATFDQWAPGHDLS